MALVDTAKIGKIGGDARAAKLSAEELSEIGRAGAEARWGKKKPGAKKKSGAKAARKAGGKK